MKKLFLAIVAALSCTAVSAQQEVGTWSIIPRIGVNLANLSNNTVNVIGELNSLYQVDDKFKAGMKVGADVEYQWTRRVAVSAGVFYSMQGSRASDFSVLTGYDTAEPTTEKHTGYSDWVTDRQYVNVPVMVHAYLAPNFAVKAGVQLGYLVKAEWRYAEQDYTVKASGEYTYEEPKSHEQDQMDAMKKLDVSIPIGLSYEYENVILDARYDIGVSKNDQFGVRNKVFEFTVGYRFAL